MSVFGITFFIVAVGFIKGDAKVIINFTLAGQLFDEEMADLIPASKDGVTPLSALTVMVAMGCGPVDTTTD